MTTHNETHEGEYWTTRATVTKKFATNWLRGNPDIPVGVNDLSKFVKQLTTEIFETGRQRRHAPLSADALHVLGRAGVAEATFAELRTFAISDDIPSSHGVIFGDIAQVLAPLAAAIQLARSAAADAAARIAKDRNLLKDKVSKEGLMTRADLRGFVASPLSEKARAVLADVGTQESVAAYLELILRDVDALATEVVDNATRKRTAAKTLPPHADERLRDCVLKYGMWLRGLAARTCGPDAQEITSDALLKLTIAFRNNPDLEVGKPYLATVLDNAAKSYRRAAGARSTREIVDSEFVDRSEDVCADTDEGLRVHGLPASVQRRMVERVLGAAARLDDLDPAGESSLARQALLRCFIEDAAVENPREAKLAARILALTESATVADDLRTIAKELAPKRSVARVVRLALDALSYDEEAA